MGSRREALMAGSIPLTTPTRPSIRAVSYTHLTSWSLQAVYCKDISEVLNAAGMVHTLVTGTLVHAGANSLRVQLLLAGAWAAGCFLDWAIIVSVSFSSVCLTVSMYLVMIGIMSCIDSAMIAGISRSSFSPVGVE